MLRPAGILQFKQFPCIWPPLLATLSTMNDHPDQSEDASEHRGRADFWRGFLYGTGNTLVLVAVVALASFLLGLVNGSAGASP